MTSLPENSIVVGVDIGTANNCGWAIVNLQAERLDSGVIKVGRRESLDVRLYDLYYSFMPVFFGQIESRCADPYRLLAVGIETPWVGKNIQTALRLGKAWGVVAGFFIGTQSIIPHTIYPTTAKKALTGSGKATKYAMVQTAAAMGMPHKVNEKGEIVGDDNEADAIGVAIATLDAWREDYLYGLG